jgi:hypothetical protein
MTVGGQWSSFALEVRIGMKTVYLLMGSLGRAVYAYCIKLVNRRSVGRQRRPLRSPTGMGI